MALDQLELFQMRQCRRDQKLSVAAGNILDIAAGSANSVMMMLAAISDLIKSAIIMRILDLCHSAGLAKLFQSPVRGSPNPLCLLFPCVCHLPTMVGSL